MAAAQTKGHAEDKHTGMQGKIKKKEEKKRKVGSKAQKQASKQDNRTQGVSIATKSSRLCYKAETGTLPHYLPLPYFFLIRLFRCH